MTELGAAAPDATAVRTALWRAMHVQIDPPPHVLEDEVGFRLAAPEEGWRQRPDMHPEWTRRIRASIVARARFIEDLVVERGGQRSSPAPASRCTSPAMPPRRRCESSRTSP